MTEQQEWSDMVRGAVSTEPAPARVDSGGGRRERSPREERWHTVEVDTTELSGGHTRRRVEGDDVLVAAALRAIANQLDPPPPPAPPKINYR